MLLFFILPSRIITIVHSIFIAETFEPIKIFSFPQRVFTRDWPNSFWTPVACSVLPFISHDKQSYECAWRRMFLPSRNLYKCKQADGIVVIACFYPFFILHFVVGCLLFNSHLFLFPLILLYFCLFINYVNKPIIFGFGAFVYYLRTPFP